MLGLSARAENEAREMQRNSRNPPDQVLRDLLLVLKSLVPKNAHTMSAQHHLSYRTGGTLKPNYYSVAAIALEDGREVVHF